MKKILLLLALYAQNSFGQEAYTLKFLPQLAESQWYNASNTPDNNLSVGLPAISSVYFSIYNTGFTYNGLIKRGANNTAVINAGDFINNLKNNNFIGIDASASLFSISYKTKKNDSGYCLGFSINDRVNLQFGYPKDFLALLWYGNGPNIGKTIKVGDFSLNASYYREYALHATKKYRKWVFGASPKLLFGKTNIHTRKSELDLYTDTSTYALTANSDFQFQTSGIPDSTDNSNGFLNSGSQVNKYIFNKQNRGLGIDLGAAYKYNDKFDFAAGINNFGFINWRSNIHNYTSSPNSFTFDGMDISSYFQGNSSTLSIQKWTDSLKKIVKFTESTANYRTTLPYELFAIGNFNLGNHHLSLQMAAQRYNLNFVYSGTLFYQIKLGQHFTGGLSYTLKKGAPANIGGALILQFVHMQWYFVTDNWYAAIKPLDSKNFNAHMGINLVWGNKKEKKDKEEKTQKNPLHS